MSDSETVRRGVEFLARLEDTELSVADAVTRLEAITREPRLVRAILERAEADGVIDRADGRIRPRDSRPLRFTERVTRREGEFTCRRCSASIGEGWFIELDAGEVGPYGSTCIRIVTGRD